MADRRVTRSGKDRDGDITSLCGSWGSAPKATAISQIELGTYRYYVQDGLGRQATVRVYQAGGRKHLRTDPNSACSDNLDNLPDC
ncbi:MAG TPA: DUF3892 domain-containing protein [Ilumatobacter sp.]|nr:DUF3892 domain-containing protein [Ilumatobacter sp.]